MVVNNSVLLSVIVPVYKAEPYIEACIQSILNQTFPNFELILINDGSPDNSLEICNKFAKIDSRIVVVDQKNSGVSKARSNGIQHSQGDWITFVDADDTIPINAFELLFSNIKSDDIDCVVGSWCKVTGNNKHIILLQERGILSKEEYIESLLSGKSFAGPVGKIFRRSVISPEDLSMPSYITTNEDLLMNLRIANKMRKINTIPRSVVYNYWKRDNSASTKGMSLDSWDELFDYIHNCFSPSFYIYIKKYICIVFFNNNLDLRRTKYYRDVLSIKKELSLFDSTRWKISYFESPSMFNKAVLLIAKRIIQIKKALFIITIKL